MRFLIIGLVLTFTVAVTASVFAIWPAVGDAPWEDEVAVVEEATDVRCEGALRFREVSIAALAEIEFWNTPQYRDVETELRRATTEVARYC